MVQDCTQYRLSALSGSGQGTDQVACLHVSPLERLVGRLRSICGAFDANDLDVGHAEETEHVSEPRNLEIECRLVARVDAAACAHDDHALPGDQALRAGLAVAERAMGVTGEGFVGDIPLIIAFVILAAFTYSSGLRAPASIAIVKDLLIYVTAFAAAIIIPIHLGGFGKIFAAVSTEKMLLAVPQGYTTGAYSTYATLALGSALALLLYPHTMTAILSATSGHTVRRNAALLPAYTFVLGLLALLGFFALADGVDKLPEFAEGFRQFKNNFAVPALFLHNFPSWFAGVAFAAIGIGALVPAAIMSIAAANLFTRNVYREFFHPRATDKQEAQMAKWVSLIVKFGALSFIVFVPLQYAIQLQLLGGVWIIQTLPTVLIGLTGDGSTRGRC